MVPLRRLCGTAHVLLCTLSAGPTEDDNNVTVTGLAPREQHGSKFSNSHITTKPGMRGTTESCGWRRHQQLRLLKSEEACQAMSSDDRLRDILNSPDITPSQVT